MTLTKVEIPREDRALFDAAWDLARLHHGNELTFYLPGMIRYGKVRGRYPAVSITGDQCELQCDHCRGMLLKPMIHASDPRDLEKKAQRLSKNGAHGILLSGGSSLSGRLPWRRFEGAIKRISRDTDLCLTAHTGFPTKEDCRILHESGIRQALIDVMGDDETARKVYHLSGLDRVRSSLDALSEKGIPLVPHVVAGLYYGSMGGEMKALEIIRSHKPAALVIVVLTGLDKTPMASVRPPSALEVARLIAHARLLMPEVPISLGCERPRNREGSLLEALALRAGVTRMAVWSEEAVEEAHSRGLIPRYQSTCCSLPFNPALEVSRD